MSASKTAQWPWQSLVALSAAAAGAVWYFAPPLDTSRPSERGGALFRINREQDVDARLWQDPLATAFAHDEQVRAIDKTKDSLSREKEKALEEELHSEFALRRQIDAVKARNDDLLVLPVLVSGGSYAEYGENRLRARRAVLEALGTNQLSPRDGEHIGYARIRRLSSSEGSVRSTGEEPKPEKDPAAPQEYLILPYEWCGPAFKGGSAERTKQVLILWVPEEELSDQPLTSLSALLRVLNVEPSLVKVVGPRTSSTLRAVADEVTADGYRPPDLSGAVIFSPTATMSDELLLRGIREDVSTVKDLLQKKVNGLTFHRMTLNDGNVCRALISELGLRGVRLALRGAPKGYRTGNDHVALISEWDTFYGRALPLSFAREVSTQGLDALWREYPENIHAFHYLRGIDGMLPGGSTQDQSAKKLETKDGPRETIEGFNQADYLRRLAVQLQEKHRILLRDKGAGLKAVGVLGSDVYDKLLVLKALRRALPGVLFFTNNLDARFGHPDEWHCARNLIIASPFGLRLAERWGDKKAPFDLQGKILPFRDSYQTATYTATLFASNDQAARLLGDYDKQQSDQAEVEDAAPRQEDALGRQLLGLPRLFEIGQSGPYELQGLIRPPKETRPDVHPDHDVRWRNKPRIGAIVVIGLSVAGLIAWIALVVRGQHRERRRVPTDRIFSARAGSRSPSSARVRRLLGKLSDVSSWAVFAVGALVAWLVVAVLSYIQRANGEPFVWMEGISIWPTETLRLLVVIMAVWYFFKTNQSLKENEATILRKFGLTSPTLRWGRFAPFLSRRWRARAVVLLTFRSWCVECQKKIVAQELWKHYIRSGEGRIRLLRVAPLILCYLAATACLMFLLGIPPVPGRGNLSFILDSLFILLAVVSSVGVTFYIADATMLNRRLIDYLVAKETKWPPEAYQNLRQRWKVSPAEKQNAPVPHSSFWHPALSLLWPPKSHTPSTPDPGSREELPPERLLDEYLDIDLIATRTEVVGGLIYYPFVLITLLIVSRISLFDNWTWPVGLFIVTACNGGYAAWSAAMLRRTAENARQVALKNLNDILIARTAEGLANGPEAQTARETVAMITAEDRGAFAAISRHPLIGALLLPSGGAGIWALTQYLPGLF